MHLRFDEHHNTWRAVHVEHGVAERGAVTDEFRELDAHFAEENSWYVQTGVSNLCRGESPPSADDFHDLRERAQGSHTPHDQCTKQRPSEDALTVTLRAIEEERNALERCRAELKRDVCAFKLLRERCDRVRAEREQELVRKERRLEEQARMLDAVRRQLAEQTLARETEQHLIRDRQGRLDQVEAASDVLYPCDARESRQAETVPPRDVPTNDVPTDSVSGHRVPEPVSGGPEYLEMEQDVAQEDRGDSPTAQNELSGAVSGQLPEINEASSLEQQPEVNETHDLVNRLAVFYGRKKKKWYTFWR